MLKFGYDRPWSVVGDLRSQWNVKLLTVSAGSLSCVNSFTDCSGLPGVCLGMPVKTKLSLMLHACKSRIVSFMVLFLVITDVNWVVITLIKCCSDLAQCLEFPLQCLN